MRQYLRADLLHSCLEGLHTISRVTINCLITKLSPE